MNFRVNHVVQGMIKSLDMFEQHLNTLKSNPDDFNELNDFLLEMRFFAMFDYISYFKEALKQSIGQNL